MICTVVDFEKDSVVYNITGATKEELDNRLNLFFTTENLLLKSDISEQKIFQKGNKILRIIFGAFIKYFKVVVTIRSENGVFTVKLYRDMNFIMSGGIIGRTAARKEFARINEAFKVYFGH